eukprot:5050641-Amphidinium_carterae.2
MAPKAATKPKTALMNAWEKESKAQPLSRGKCDDLSDLATRTRKAINDNLKGFLTEAEIYGTVIEGRTCFQQVMADKEKWIKGELGPMGCKYWADIRCRFQGPDNARKLIEIPADSPVDKALISAVEAALKHPPQRAQLLGVCRRMTLYKKGNCLALMKMLTSVCPSASAKQLELGMELLECVQRIGGFTKCEKEAALLRPKVDSILLQVVLKNFQKVLCLALSCDGLELKCVLRWVVSCVLDVLSHSPMPELLEAAWGPISGWKAIARLPAF